MKLKATKPSLIADGINEPIRRVMIETTLIGKIQYPSMQALWKKDLNGIKALHFWTKEISI